MNVPDQVKERVKTELWTIADELEWISLPLPEKSRYYDLWSRSEDVGGQLARFLSPRAVRVYIKDTLMKPYTRERLSDPAPILSVLGIPLHREVSEEYVKPHGILFSDGGVICWSRGQDWKTTVIAARERAEAVAGRIAEAVVLVGAAPRYSDSENGRDLVRKIVSDLGVRELYWLGI